MIPFNKPYFSGRELKYLEEVCHSTTMSGNGDFTKKCHTFFEQKYGFKKCLLATSGTDALEMCAMLCNLKPGDEVIVPSYTFVSTALAFLREGAKVVFADSSAENPNMEVEQIEPLINEKTKVIAVVHYAGVACDMDAIMALAEKHNLLVVEDAAHCIDSFYKGRPLGSIGHWALSLSMRPKTSVVVKVVCALSMTIVLFAVPKLFGRRVPTVPSSIVEWSTSMVG